MEGDFLSNIIDPDDIGGYGCLNLIVAPCGAGKTTLALDVLAPRYGNLSRALYLIDTIAGQDQLLQNPKCRCYDKEWRYMFTDTSLIDDGKIVVMTYARFGTLCKNFKNWYLGLDTIICDEIHRLFEMRAWSRSKGIPDEDNVYEIAWNVLFSAFFCEIVPAVYGLTATPGRLYDEFVYKGLSDDDPLYGSIDSEWMDRCVYKVPLYGTPRHYEQRETVDYANLTMLCNRLPLNQKGIIYVPRIGQINKYVDILTKRGICAVGIWSTNNEDWWMDRQQMAVRQYIIENAAIPEDVDVLIINKSCETSINIKSHIDYMVIHSTQNEVRTQALGRYRNDLDTVYLYEPEIIETIPIPVEMLGIPLYKEDIDNFIASNNIRDDQGRLMKQPSFLKYISFFDYDVQSKKHKGGKRYHIITERSIGTQK